MQNLALPVHEQQLVRHRSTTSASRNVGFPRPESFRIRLRVAGVEYRARGFIPNIATTHKSDMLVASITYLTYK